jgi:hypothetical protein
MEEIKQEQVKINLEDGKYIDKEVVGLLGKNLIRARASNLPLFI